MWKWWAHAWTTYMLLFWWGKYEYQRYIYIQQDYTWASKHLEVEKKVYVYLGNERSEWKENGVNEIRKRYNIRHMLGGGMSICETKSLFWRFPNWGHLFLLGFELVNLRPFFDWNPMDIDLHGNEQTPISTKINNPNWKREKEINGGIWRPKRLHIVKVGMRMKIRVKINYGIAIYKV